MDLGEDWSNNEIIQAVAIGEFTNLDGIEWRNGAETAADEFLMRLPVRKVPLQTKYNSLFTYPKTIKLDALQINRKKTEVYA